MSADDDARRGHLRDTVRAVEVRPRAAERGAVLLRLPTDLAEWLTARATRRDISRNALVVEVLEQERKRSALPGHASGCSCSRCT